MRACACLLALAVALAPARARAQALAVALRPGVATRALYEVSAGPSLGLSARLGLNAQWQVTLVGSFSRHEVGHSTPFRLWALGGGLRYLIDAAPVLPFLEAGILAVTQVHQEHRSLSAWPFVGGALLLAWGSHFFYGLDARCAIVPQEGFAPDYVQISLELGFTSHLTRP